MSNTPKIANTFRRSRAISRFADRAGPARSDNVVLLSDVAASPRAHACAMPEARDQAGRAAVFYSVVGLGYTWGHSDKPADRPPVAAPVVYWPKRRRWRTWKP